MKKIVFLKLGGSVITDKDHANTANLERIDIICREIFKALQEDPSLHLLIGHGSGSFGHFAATKYDTRNGVNNPREWIGFSEVAYRARQLNQIVIEHLQLAGIPAISVSPFSSISSTERQITKWNIDPITSLLNRNLIPVIYGDVVIDSQFGGTIFSTEELFDYLSSILKPTRILLAGLENGIYRDFPTRNELIKLITPQSFPSYIDEIQKSVSPDVTGGMRSKVEKMVSLVLNNPEVVIQVFSAVETNNLYNSLIGKKIGTTIRNPERK